MYNITKTHIKKYSNKSKSTALLFLLNKKTKRTRLAKPPQPRWAAPGASSCHRSWALSLKSCSRSPTTGGDRRRSNVSKIRSWEEVYIDRFGSVCFMFFLLLFSYVFCSALFEIRSFGLGFGLINVLVCFVFFGYFAVVILHGLCCRILCCI